MLKLWLMLISAIMIFSPSGFAGKTELTTYYPAPYGEYTELRVTGDSGSNDDHALEARGSSGTGLVVTNANNVGIGTANPRLTLEILASGLRQTPLGIATNTPWGVLGQNGYQQMLALMDFERENMGGIFLGTAAGVRYAGINFFQPGDHTQKINFAMLPWGGNVGIGTTTPAHKLDVSGAIRSSNEIISTNANAFRMIHGNYGCILRNDGQNTYFLLTNPGDQYGGWNTLRPLRFNNSTGYVTFGCGHNDLAENFLISGKILRGGLVSIDPSRPFAAIAADPLHGSFLGIISTKPGVVMDADGGVSVGIDTKMRYENEKAPVALVGTAPALVTSQNGPIAIGDAIGLSSFPGFGAKAITAGSVAGKALETFNSTDTSCQAVSSLESIEWPEDDGKNSQKPCFELPDGTRVGKIMAAVNVSWYDPGANGSDPDGKSASATSADVANLLEMVKDQKERIERLEQEIGKTKN